MKLLLFKNSSCSTCQRQEELLKKHGVQYVPLELFKNRELARRYGVTDVPTTLLVDNDNNVVKRYNFPLNSKQIENINVFLQN